MKRLNGKMYGGRTMAAAGVGGGADGLVFVSRAVCGVGGLWTLLDCARFETRRSSAQPDRHRLVRWGAGSMGFENDIDGSKPFQPLTALILP